jgi:hypothetical protein
LGVGLPWLTLTPSMENIVVYDFPGRTIFLERVVEEDDVARSDTTIAIAPEAAKQIAGDDIQFFFADLVIGPVDATYLFPIYDVVEDGDTFSFLTNTSPANIDKGPLYAGTNVVLGDLEWPTLDNAIRQVLVERRARDPEPVVLWKQIYLRGVRARIRGISDLSFLVQWGNRQWPYPMEAVGADRFIWQPDNRSVLSPPMTIDLTFDFGIMAIKINVSWSYWAEDGFEGTCILRAAVEQLLAHGWSWSDRMPRWW